MTANQSSALAKNPNTKKAIAVLTKFAAKEAEFKKLAAEVKDAEALILNAMVEQGVKKLDIDLPNLTGYITLVERTTYKADDIEKVPEQFTKVVKALDSEKVKASAVLSDDLPKGVSKSVSTFITKKFKAVE
jgi:hypothetical protein